MRRGRGGSGNLAIDGYSDLVEIGSGTSATVYRAFQESFQRQVALKILTADISDQRAQRRFVSERAMTGRLSRHPNIVTVYDSGFANGRRPFLAMEYFARGSYADVGQLPVADVIRVGVKIAGALESAHRAGVIHRDVKPQNILLSGYGEPVLADFGLAVAADPEASFTAGLTPAHAAPELLEGGQPSVATDIYALGSTLYTLLAGQPPFAGPVGEGLLAQFRRIAEGSVPDPPRTDVPPTVMRLLRRAVATAPLDRYRTAAELGRALQAEQAALGQPITELVLEAETALAQPSRSIVAPGPLDETATRAAVFAPPTPAPVTTAPAAAAPVDPVGTVTGRLPTPAAPEPPPRPRSRRTLLVVVVTVAVFALGGVGVLLLGTVGAKTPAADRTAIAPASAVPGSAVPGSAVPPPPTSIATRAPSVTATAQNTAPTGVTVSPDSAGLERLTWHDHTGGTATSLVYASVSGAPYALRAEAQRGVMSAVVTVTAQAPTCFRVFVAISIGDTPGSTPVCINGGVAPVATPS